MVIYDETNKAKDLYGKDIWTRVRKFPKNQRNLACKCGSGKKYKNCCYAKDMEDTNNAEV